MATSAEIANLIAEQGRLAAEGKRRVGQIYGNLFSNIGTTIGNIPAQLQEQKILQANAAIRNQQMQIGQFQLQSAQRAQMGQQVLAKAIQQYPDDPKAVAREVSKFSPELGTEYLKGQSDLATHAANLDELNRKRLAADSALLGDAAFQSEQSSDPSTAFTARLAAFKDRLSPETLKQLQKVQTPDDAEAFRKARIQDSPLWQEQQKERTKVRDIHEGDVVGSIAGGVMMKGQPKPKTPTELLLDAANPESPTQAQSTKAVQLRTAMTPYQEAQLAETKKLRAIEQQNANTAAKRSAEAPDKLVRVEHKDPQTGKTIIEWLPQSSLKGQQFEKGAGATESNRAASAEAVAQTGNDIIAKLSDPKFAAEVGPVMGRYNSVRDWVGNPPPELSELAGTIDSYSLANMGVHGMRSVQGAELIQKLLNTKHTPESLIAAIKGLNKFSEHYMENQGRTVPGATPKRDKNPFK